MKKTIATAIGLMILCISFVEGAPAKSVTAQNRAVGDQAHMAGHEKLASKKEDCPEGASCHVTSAQEDFIDTEEEIPLLQEDKAIASQEAPTTEKVLPIKIKGGVEGITGQ